MALDTGSTDLAYMCRAHLRCAVHEPRAIYLARYSSRVDRLMRHDVPIFLPASSPDSRIDMTSVSGTPSAWATSAGDNISGNAVAGAAVAPFAAVTVAPGTPPCC